MTEANCELCEYLNQFSYERICKGGKKRITSQTCKVKMNFISHHYFGKFGKECENKGWYRERKMTEAEREQRQYALAISGGVCEVCGKPLIDGHRQAAHRIGNTKANRQKYGDFVIDHRFNVGYTCSLGCNSELDISRNAGEVIKLIQKIYSAEAQRFGGSK